jgi:hypothetical protein
VEQVKLSPYNSGPQKEIPAIPAVVQSFIAGEFSPSCSGHDVKIESDSFNTGHGMDYLNQLIVKNGRSVVYDSGMLLWRNGRPGCRDSYENCFRKVGLKADGDKILLGVEDGNGRVSIYELTARGRRFIEASEVHEIEEAVEAAKIQVTDLASFKKHFEKGKDSYWSFSNHKFDCEFGPAALVYHNDHPTDVVWDFIQILVMHEGKPYISDMVQTSLEWHGKFTNSVFVERKVEGNRFEITLSSGYHKNAYGHPVTLSFELVLPIRRQ